jgi:hypothetical protein
MSNVKLGRYVAVLASALCSLAFASSAQAQIASATKKIYMCYVPTANSGSAYRVNPGFADAEAAPGAPTACTNQSHVMFAFNGQGIQASRAFREFRAFRVFKAFREPPAPRPQGRQG